MKNEKNFENINLKINTEKAESRSKIIEEALAAIDADVDKALENVEMPTDGEVQARIKAMLYEAGKMEQESLKKTDEKPKDTAKVKKTRKNIGKTLLLVAVITVLAMTCVITTVASKHNISIENGFVAYMKEAIVITFFGESEEKYISIDVLKASFENNGYYDVVIPKYFDTVDWKVTVPEYADDGFTKQVSFDIYNDEYRFGFIINELTTEDYNNPISFLELDNAETIKSENMDTYVFDYGNGTILIKYFDESYKYTVTSYVDYGVMQDVAKNIE